MTINLKGIFNRTPDALTKLASIGIGIENMKLQRDMAKMSAMGSIWNGYGGMGMGFGAYGGFSNGWDIVNAACANMQQVVDSAGAGCSGLSDCGGGAASVTQSPGELDPSLGQSVARGKNAKFIDSEDWETLNNNPARTPAETNSLNTYYKKSLKGVATSFKQAIDKNRDGKVTSDEFKSYFKKMMHSQYKNLSSADIDELCDTAWKSVNFNTTDFADALDDEELMALLASFDASDTNDINGEITADGIRTALSKIAAGQLSPQAVYSQISAAPAEPAAPTEPATPVETDATASIPSEEPTSP